MARTPQQPGARLTRRLREERLIWLTTVRADGAPQTSLVWFLWDGDEFQIYSMADKPKLRNIEHNPRVALNLNSDPFGGSVVVFGGEARVAPDASPAREHPAYLAKYRGIIVDRLGMSVDEFSDTYSVPIVVRPTSLREW